MIGRFREPRPGVRDFTVWVQPNMKKYLLCCCDCGLVHEMQFRIDKRKNGSEHVQFRARRAERYTARERKRVRRGSKG